MIATVAATVVFASCNNGPQGPYAMVAAVLKDENSEYWQQIQNAISSSAYYSNFPYFTATVDSEYDIDGQLKMLDTLKMIKNYQTCGFILAPIYTETDHRMEQAVLDYCKPQNIPVVLIDNPIDEIGSPLSEYYKCFVGTDNKAAGEKLAEKVAEESDKIIVIGMRGNAPAQLRYAGWCEKKGQPLAYRESTDETIASEIDGILAEYPEATTVVFLNGSLCAKVLSALNGMEVYTFDAFKETFANLKGHGCVKGIMAQNTFAMGELAFKALFATVGSKTLYVDPVYLSLDTIRDGSDANVLVFVKFYNF